MSLPQNNPYFSNSKGLSPYNWYGIYNKRTNSSGNLNFTSAEFASDINDVLDDSGLSEANVVSSYIDGVLTIRGFQSNTIDFSITDEDCILYGSRW